MAWVIDEPNVIQQGIAQTSTTQNHALGKVIRAKDSTLGEGEFIYMKGITSTTVGSWVGYNTATGATVLAVANGNYPLAVAMSTNSTTTSYGWYQISGNAKALGLTSITYTSGFLWLTATPGSVDDASVIGDAVVNAHKTSTVHVVGTFLDTYHIQRPFSANRVFLSN